MHRRSCYLVALASLLIGLPAAAAPPSREYSIKAAFLYKFADYVEWPAAAFGSQTNPLTVCVVGDDPFGPILDQLVQGERAAGHPIAIKRMPTLDSAAGCMVAFIATKGNVGESLGNVTGKPVLTITDGADETGAHGIVNFVIRDNRVRFDIDTRLAADNGLAISSDLLRLAANVYGPDNPKGDAR